MIRRRVLTAPKLPAGDRTPAAATRILGPVPRPLLAVALVGALSLAACGSGQDDDVASGRSTDPTTTTVATGATTAPGARPSPAAAVPEELDFVAPDVRGGQVVGGDLAGKDLVIWFWAPW